MIGYIVKQDLLLEKKLYDWGGKDLKPMLDDKDFIDQYVQSIEARIRVKTGGIVKKRC